MYVSSLQNIYNAVYIQVAKHIASIVQKIEMTGYVGFLNLQFTQQLLRVFTSLLAFLATLYEFVSYCTVVRVSSFISSTAF